MVSYIQIVADSQAMGAGCPFIVVYALCEALSWKLGCSLSIQFILSPLLQLQLP